MNPDEVETDVESDVASNYVTVFDTTLRDGEQAPGFTMKRG